MQRGLGYRFYRVDAVRLLRNVALEKLRDKGVSEQKSLRYGVVQLQHARDGRFEFACNTDALQPVPVTIPPHFDGFAYLLDIWFDGHKRLSIRWNNWVDIHIVSFRRGLE